MNWLKNLFPFLFPQPKPEPVITLADIEQGQIFIQPDQYQKLTEILQEIGLAKDQFQILNQDERGEKDQWARVENGSVIALSFRNSQFDQFAKLRHFPALKELSLESCGLEGIPDFYPSDSVKTLYLGGNQIQDLTNLACFPNLEYLALNWNHLTSLHTFPHLPALLTLNLTDNQIQDLEGFVPGKNLNSLSLASNQLKTFDRIDIIEQVNYLNLDRNLLRILQPDLSEITPADELTLQAVIKAFDKKHPVRSGRAQKSRGSVTTRTNIFSSSSQITGKGRYESIRGYYQRKLAKGMHIHQVNIRVSVSTGILRVKLSDREGVVIPSRPIELSGNLREGGYYEKWIVFETITPEVKGVEFELF
ncbi:MAG: hypothetical protein KDE26_13090 [Bacteroidetes bacterium]|nr:hypothetical protein [Bacteroidota bacterium]